MKALLISLGLFVSILAQESLVIIGGGPAGYSAAIWAARLNLNPLVIEGVSENYIPSFLIENYPGFPEGIDRECFIENLRQQALKAGAQRLEGWVTQIEEKTSLAITLSSGQTVFTQAVIVATGREKKKLGLANEGFFLGKGIGFCPLCEGPLYQGETVIVTGRGDTAEKDALLLSEWAEKVIVLADVSAPMPKNVQVMPHKTVVELIGSEAEGLTHVRVKDNRTEEHELLATHGLFVSNGWAPNTQFLKSLVDLDESGYIVTAPSSSKTSITGIFAAGDIIDPKTHQLILAVASGCKAALDAKEYLNHVESLSTYANDPVSQR